MFPWRISGSGITFITTFRKEICFVFGREKNKTKKVGYDLYEDFGGGIDRGESLKEAAIRECYEETCKTIKLKDISEKIIVSMKTYRYGIFFVRLPNNFFSKFNTTFNQNRKELERIGEDKHYLEIDNIKLVPIKNLIDRNKHNLIIKKGYYSKEMLSLDVETMDKDRIILGGRIAQLFYPDNNFNKDIISIIEKLKIVNFNENVKNNIKTFTQ